MKELITKIIIYIYIYNYKCGNIKQQTMYERSK